MRKVTHSSPTRQITNRFRTTRTFLTWRINLRSRIRGTFLRLVTRIRQNVNRRLSFRRQVIVRRLHRRQTRPHIGRHIRSPSTCPSSLTQTNFSQLLRHLRNIRRLLNMFRRFRTIKNRTRTSQIARGGLRPRFAFGRHSTTKGQHLNNRRLIYHRTGALRTDGPGRNFRRLRVRKVYS